MLKFQTKNSLLPGNFKTAQHNTYYYFINLISMYRFEV